MEQAQNRPETQPDNAVTPVFRQRMAAPRSYADIPLLRDALGEFLHSHGVDPAATGRLLLTLSEVLTNLVKHPARKAETLSISLTLGHDGAHMDIADDSTPFAAFETRCAHARNRKVDKCLRENGYGLSCILQQHAAVRYVPQSESGDGLNHFIIRDDAQAAPLTKKTVFVIDDDPLTLDIHTCMLQNNYNVRAFSSACAALAAFREQRPDLIVSDLSMPEMDGAALRRALAGESGGNETPFIFISGRTEDKNNARLNSLGIDGFICKPVNKDNLLVVVDRLVRRAAQMRQAIETKLNHGVSNLLDPNLPQKWEGWHIHLRRCVAEAGGGDFILHDQRPDQLLFILADVMGHGHTAKFFAYAYAGYLRSIFKAARADMLDPHRFMEKLSDCTASDPFLESTIMTCQSLCLTPQGDVQIVSAGHPPPLLITQDTCRVIDVSGPLPGLTPQNEYATTNLRLNPQEKILLATDGFYDAFDDAPLDHAALAEEVLRHQNISATALTEHLWRSFRHRAQHRYRPPDDSTLIILEYTGP